MARPPNKDYRAAILGAFDRHTIRNIKEINNYLKEVDQFTSYASTRRMLIRLCNEGLLSELPGRGNKNAIQYTKLILNQSIALVTFNKQLVETKRFIDELIPTKFPEVIHPQAEQAIKQWMLDTLASTYPQGYEDKRELPDPDSLKQKLETTLEMLKDVHQFIKGFLESGAFSPVARQYLSEDFRDELAEYHAAIVDNNWRS